MVNTRIELAGMPFCACEPYASVGGQIKRNAAAGRDQGDTFLPPNDKVTQGEANPVTAVKRTSARQLAYVINGHGGTHRWFRAGAGGLNGVIEATVVGCSRDFTGVNVLF